MNDIIIKVRVEYKDLGISSMPGISEKYWAKKKADQERWEKEDKERKAK